jgi:glutathione S-transferase
MITVTAFRWVPPLAQGLVRDFRVRWALEEAGLRYQEKLIGLGQDQASEEYRRQQPFGQVPVYEEEGLTLFESGAIVLHIAEKSEVLMPREPAARARAITWMFAALNSMEPHIWSFVAVDSFFANEEWAKLRRPSALQLAEKRLDELATWMKGREWLEDRFTAGDLLMSSVLRILRNTDLLAARPALEAYRQRCEARPAFQKALADQLAPFAKYAPQRP